MKNNGQSAEIIIKKMKTYLLSIPQRLKQQSATLDVKALLCNNAWDIINNDGQKQMFLFHNDGSLVVSTNGNVSICEWRLEPLAGTIVISSKDHAEMFKAGMVQKILVLAKDGSNEVLSLIDSKNTEIIPNRTVNELTAYLNYQDRLIEERLQKDKLIAEQQITNEEERTRQKELAKIHFEEERQKEIQELATYCQNNKLLLVSEYKNSKFWTLACLLVLLLGPFIIAVPTVILACNDCLEWLLWTWIVIGSLLYGLGYFLTQRKANSFNPNINIVIWETLKKKCAGPPHLSYEETISIASKILEIDLL